MISNVLYAIGVICLVLAFVGFLGVFAIGTAAPSTLLIIGITAIVVAYFIGSRSPRV